MNIFFISAGGSDCATSMCDEHVRKMIIETGQMLSFAHHYGFGDSFPDYVMKPSKPHMNHPCSKWTRMNTENYAYMYNLFVNLSHEYRTRFGKVHASFTRFNNYLCRVPDLGRRLDVNSVGYYLNCYEDNWQRQDVGWTNFAQFPICIGEPHKYLISDNVIRSYRMYYVRKNFKRGKKTWTRRNLPDWWQDAQTMVIDKEIALDVPHVPFDKVEFKL